MLRDGWKPMRVETEKILSELFCYDHMIEELIAYFNIIEYAVSRKKSNILEVTTKNLHYLSKNLSEKTRCNEVKKMIAAICDYAEAAIEGNVYRKDAHYRIICNCMYAIQNKHPEMIELFASLRFDILNLRPIL